MYLYLDTIERDSFKVAIIDNGKVLRVKTILSVRQHSEKLLSTINKLLNQPSPYPLPGRERGLEGIAVVKGPGSFTSLRVGIATANALAYALSVSVVGVKSGFTLEKLDTLFHKPKKLNIVLPEYGSEPHITVKKPV